MKLWAGRLSGETDARMTALNASIGFDSRFWRQDITGSMAHAKMLETCGIISKADGEAIQNGLAAILADLESGALAIDMTAEDIHTFVEAELTSRIGDAGKRLHTARSRNDQVATDMRLYVLDEINEIRALLHETAETLANLAGQHLTDVMPGYTHLQRAQPVTLAQWLMAYCFMLLRDADRLSDCKKRTAVLPLGSGALAGTGFPINRAYTAELLGFSGVTENSMDGVSDRDFVLELLSDLSILMVHLSRMSEEMILWSSGEFAYLSFSDDFSTGSSIMPQKKNPDAAELIRGKAGRVIGDSVTLLTVMKGLPLAYNKDMQEDKEAAFDAIDTVKLCLSILPPMLNAAVFRTDNMRKAAAHGFINATDCADYLTGRGMPFRDAYKITGELVRFCTERGLTLETLPLSDYQAKSPLFASDVFDAIDLVRCVEKRTSEGGPAPSAVQTQIAIARQLLKDA